MDIKARLKQSLQQHKYFVFMFFFFIFVYIYTTFNSDSQPAKEKLLTVDTLIPNGYALVPIELENIAAIASLIESYGVVDIYLGKVILVMRKKSFKKLKFCEHQIIPMRIRYCCPITYRAYLCSMTGRFLRLFKTRLNQVLILRWANNYKLKKL